MSDTVKTPETTVPAVEESAIDTKGSDPSSAEGAVESQVPAEQEPQSGETSPVKEKLSSVVVR